MYAYDNIIIKSGYLQVLEEGFFRKNVYQRRFFVLIKPTLNTTILTWKTKEEDETPERTLILKFENVSISKNEEKTGLVVKTDEQSVTLKAESLEEATAWIMALHKSIQLFPRRFILSKEDVRDNPSAAGEAVSPSIECEIDLYGATTPFDTPNPPNDDECCMNSPPTPKRRPEHVSTDSVALNLEANAFFQSDNFRNRLFSTVSNCSTLGDGFWTPSSTDRSMSNIFAHFAAPEDLPPVPESPPPRASISVGPIHLGDIPSVGGDHLTWAFHRRDPRGKGAKAPPIERDPSLRDTDFYRKWMAIRKGKALCVE